MGYSTLNGLLCSQTVKVTPAQLLALVQAPVVLVGGQSSAFVNLLRSLILSLEFGTTPFSAPFGSAAAVYYGIGSRYPASGLGFQNGPSWGLFDPATSATNGPAYSVSAVGNASAGNTTYAADLRGAPTNLFAGFYVDASAFGHSSNNGRFLCVSHTQTAIVLANGAGVSDSGGLIVIEFPASIWGAAAVGSPNDLTPLLTQSVVSCVHAYQIDSWDFPTAEVAGASLVLGNPLPLLGNPQNLIGGDSSLIITAEFLQVPVSG
jgi:hypothetical protein